MGRKELQDPEAAELEVRGSHVIAPVGVPFFPVMNSVLIHGPSVPMMVPAPYTTREPANWSAAFHNDFRHPNSSGRRNIPESDTKISDILMLPFVEDPDLCVLKPQLDVLDEPLR